MANLITEAGVNRVVTLDLHAAQIQGFFDIPTDNLYGAPVMVRDIQERYTNGNVMIVSPDVGGVARARATAQRIGADLAIVDKRRPKAGVSEVMNITHGVLSEGAAERIAASKLKELVITDSIIATDAAKAAKNIRIISIAPLMGEAIARTASEQSVSSLLD